MKSEITVGVVIPTFNRPELVTKAVDSVLNQTYPVSEIVVVDDGSSELNYAKLQKNLTGKGVRILRTDGTSNPGKARNLGIRTMKSDFVAFLDDDDLWLPRKIEMQVRYLEMSGAKALSTRTTGHLVTFEQISETINFGDLVHDNILNLSGVIVDLQILEKVGFFATSYSVRALEDWATWLRIAHYTEWHILNEKLVVYEQQSADSVRKNDDYFDQPYRPYFAYLDFLAWAKSQSISVRYYSLLLRIFKFNLKFFSLLTIKSRSEV